MWNLMKMTMAKGAASIRCCDLVMINDIVKLEEDLFGESPFEGYERLPDFTKTHTHLDFETGQEEDIKLDELAVIGMDGAGVEDNEDPAKSCFNDIEDEEVTAIATWLEKRPSWLMRRTRMPLPFTKVRSNAEYAFFTALERTYWKSQGKAPTTAAEAKEMDFAGFATAWNRRLREAWRERAPNMELVLPGVGTMTVQTRDISPKDAATLQEWAVCQAERRHCVSKVNRSYPGA